MQSLVNFQGNKVEMLRLDNLVYFNPYDVGRCLELSDSAVRMAMSKMSDKQSVILKNSDVKIIDIRKLNNAGERFLTESGVYKLAFKSNKPNAEQFADWIADEVLPSIRKTGTYSVKTENKPVPIKELVPKHYNGQPVVTIEDIALASGKTPCEIRYHVNSSLIRGKDYYFLTGNELDKFKEENKSISKLASSLIVVNEQGFMKLARAIKGMPTLDSFKNALPELKLPMKHFNYAKGQRVDIPDNREAQELIRDLKQKAMALLELLKQVSMYTVDEEYLATIKVIESLGSRISSSCGDFRRIKYKLKEMYL